jgi:hypothetical protein
VAQEIFTAPYAWANGFYMLALDLEEHSNDRSDEHSNVRSDERSHAALSALSSYPLLDGWYLDRGKEPQEQPRVDARAPVPVEDHRYGVLTLPNGKRVPCGCYVFHTGGGPHWLEFYIPLAALDKIYPTGGFPWGPSQGYTAWEQEVDLALVEVARHIYRQVRFPAGLIGHEILYDDMDHVYWAAVAGLPPENLRYGFLWSGASSLEWHPPQTPTKDTHSD